MHSEKIKYNVACIVVVLLSFTEIYSLKVPLTIHERLIHTDTIAAINRISAPVTVGLPIPEALNIRSTDQLGLSGVSTGQFRAIQHWKSGAIKWVVCDFLADCSAKSKNTSVSLIDGHGNFGGMDLALETDTSIIVNTGIAEFHIRKHKFNLIDYAKVNNTVLVRHNRSRGIVVKGNGGGDNRLFMSSLDSLDTVVLEENGPVKTTVYAVGRHLASDGKQNFMYHVRLRFYKGKSTVDIDYSLANDSRYQPNNGFAYWVQLEVALELSGSKKFTFSSFNDTVSGIVNGKEAVLYQGRSSYPIRTSPDMKLFVPDSGFRILNGTDTLRKGSINEWWMRFWGRVADNNGAGLIGTIELAAALFPKSMGIDSTGTWFFGIYPKENTVGAYRFSFSKQFSTHLQLDFHSTGKSAERSAAEFQYPLIAKASDIEWYNESGALLDKLVTFEKEDSFFTAYLGTANYKYSTSKFWGGLIMEGASPGNITHTVFRGYYTGTGGGDNQACFSRKALYHYLRESDVVRAGSYYFYANNRIRYMNDNAMYRSHDFKFSRTDAPFVYGTYGAFGGGTGFTPDSNRSHGQKDNYDGEHQYWYGSNLLYQITGDGKVLDAVRDYANYSYHLWGIGGYSTQDYLHGRMLNGFIETMTYAYELLGDSLYLNQLMKVLNNRFVQYDAHPDPNPLANGSDSGDLWKDRGAITGRRFNPNGNVSCFFNKGLNYRALYWAYSIIPFSHPLKDGIRDALNALGHFVSKEIFFNFNTPPSHDLYPGAYIKLAGSIYHYPMTFDSLKIDLATGALIASRNDSNVLDGESRTLKLQQGWYHLIGNEALFEDPNNEEHKYWELRIHQNPPGGGNGWWKWQYGHSDILNTIYYVTHPERFYKWRPFTVQAVSTGQGNYRLSWQVPEGATCYQIKYSDKPIVEWNNFNPLTRKYEYSPIDYCNWAKAQNISGEPLPATSGSNQEMVFSCTDTGKTLYFMGKFYNGPLTESGTWINSSETANIIDNSNYINVYPNPFNPSINIFLPIRSLRNNKAEGSPVSVSIINVRGQIVKQWIYNKNIPDKINWNANKVSSGVYIVRVMSSGKRLSTKIILSR
ncbi:MAG: T9SS type A sorting domain-containing protein [Fibrobacteres bacterium]|nr:T9SS type A sorting domain-containing protein [Fibrobacterota bacterium]